MFWTWNVFSALLFLWGASILKGQCTGFKFFYTPQTSSPIRTVECGCQIRWILQRRTPCRPFISKGNPSPDRSSSNIHFNESWPMGNAMNLRTTEVVDWFFALRNGALSLRQCSFSHPVCIFIFLRRPLWFCRYHFSLDPGKCGIPRTKAS